LGPLVTDIAPGYDHITAAIGGAVAAAKGADFLCYVTPAEHLRLPTLDDVKDGVIASKIAAHAADIAKGVPKANKRDIDISRARKARDWESQFAMALDSEKPRRYRKASRPEKKDVCTMCGDYCSIKISSSCIKR
ncbi:MAG: phosphomethylpyrimidine synthase ThiC, partial [Candidatus Omnitrophica bacterium]|nr:phosphomethylpyrimidine synthase ThiC [Candidatus Omnitrophota bacterium]